MKLSLSICCTSKFVGEFFHPRATNLLPFFLLCVEWVKNIYECYIYTSNKEIYLQFVDKVDDSART